MSGLEHDLRRYRRLSFFVGAVYLVWWLAVEAMLPEAYNPLLGRALVVLAIWSVVPASYASAWARRHVRLLWVCGLWLMTAHYYYLFYENAGDINWTIGSFITVSAISLGLDSRASLLAYSLFAVALSLGLVIALPSLRQSVFLPGLFTVVLQANIGLHSRLGVLRDLAASNSHFQLLFNSTFEGVVIYEHDRIVQVNAALLRVLGYAAGELSGRDLLELVHPDDRELARAGLANDTGVPTEVRAIRKDGSQVDLELRSKPFQQRASRPSRLVTVEDISERKRQAVALRQSNDALARSNLDLQRFAYVASHDLQTPLRSIASFVDLVRTTYDDKLDAEGRDWLARTSQSVEHLQTLVRELLEYSRVDVDPRPLEMVSMRDVFDRASTLLEAAVRDTSTTIEVDALPEIMGDRSQLVRLMMNLVGNGIKYRGTAAPQIRITAESRGDDWLFAVRDNGIGIAPKHHKQVFEIFKRLHDAKEYPGTGIGLAVCRRIVDRHGGQIWVESQVGDGSVFYFTISKGPVSAR